MGLLDIFGFGSNARGRADDIINESKSERNESRKLLASSIEDLRSAAEDVREDSDKTVEQRFGRTLEKQQDRIQSNVGSAQNLISRSIAASGGDLTGEAASQINKVTESGNRRMSKNINNLSIATERINRQNRREANDIISGIPRLALSKLSIDNRNLRQGRKFRRDINRSRGNFFSDLIGTAGSVVGEI